MSASLISRLAAHVAATRDAPSPTDLLIAEALEAMQWRPIAEAPHNGNSVLVRGRFDSMWVEHVFDGEDFCEEATHFMLLPSPPERDDA